MESNEIIAKVELIFKDLLDDDTIAITEDTSQNNFENWDSLFHITLMNIIENEFGIKFTMEEIIDNKSIKTIVKCIGEKKCK